MGRRDSIVGEAPNIGFVKTNFARGERNLLDEPLFHIGAEGRSAHAEDFHGLPGSDQMAVLRHCLPDTSKEGFDFVLGDGLVRSQEGADAGNCFLLHDFFSF